MSAAEDVLVSLGCDYLTATAKEKDTAERLYLLGNVLFRTQRDFGNESRPWGMHGFSGHQCGSVQVGRRDDEVCVRLSSDSAARSWKRLVQHAENITRIDLQATVQLDHGVSRRIDRYKRAGRLNSIKHGNKRRVRWVQEHHGGYTLYLGNRQSNVFGRIYDKAAESGLPEFANCVRFEAQFQNKLARFVANQLWSIDSPMPTIASYVTQFFHSRGVELELPYNASATYCCSRPRSDLAKTLAWFSSAVKPAVERLIASGHGEEVLTALGLVVESEVE